MTAKYYVTMTDRFMSGWGKADGKTNKLVISCHTWEEAETVARNASRRHEMKYVNITSHRPSYNPDRFCVSWHGRNEGDYESWFDDQIDWQ